MKTWIKKPLGISIAVNDLDNSVKTWADAYGIGPWRFFKYGPDNVQDLELDGISAGSADACVGAAVTEIDGFEIKLLCSCEKGNAVTRFLEKHGEGIFSVKYEVSDYQKLFEDLTQKKGHAQLLKGKIQGVDFCFVDAYDAVWHIMEIESGRQAYPAERMYPEDGAPPSAKAQFTKVFQIAFMVYDARQTIVKMVDEYGLGPFKLHELSRDSIKGPIVDGKPMEYSSFAGMAMYGDLEYELIQPGAEDQNVCTAALERHGNCLQHIGYRVPDYKEAEDFLINQRGCVMSLRGTLGEGEKTHTFLYAGTEKDIANMVELNDTHPEWPGLPSIFDYPAQ